MTVLSAAMTHPTPQKTMPAKTTLDGHSRMPMGMGNFTQPVIGVLLFSESRYAENDDPHPQVLVAFGFLMTNCAPSRPSW